MSKKQKKSSSPPGPPGGAVKKAPPDRAANQQGDNPPPSGHKVSKRAGRHPEKRPRRFRRLLWISVILLALIIVLRVILWASLPWFLNKAVNEYGLRCTYERLNLSLLTGDAELWHLVLKLADKDDLLAHVEYCRAEVSLTTLLARRLVVPRIEVDGMDVTVTRAPDGTFLQFQNLLKVLEAQQSRSIESDAHTEVRPVVQGEIDLTPPIKLDALRLQHVQVNFRDESVFPILETRLDVNVRLSDLGSEKRQTRFQIMLSSPPVLDQFLVEGTGTSQGMDLLADVRIALNGLHPPSLKDYLGPLEISPEAESLALTCSGHIRTQGIFDPYFNGAEQSADPENSVGEGEMPLVPRTLGVRMDLSGIVLTADGLESFALDHVVIDANLPRSDNINLSNIEVAGGRAHLAKRADNAMSIAGMKFTGEPHREPTSGVHVEMSADASGSNSVVKETSRFKWSLGNLSFKDLRVFFHDESISPQTDLAFIVRMLTADSMEPDKATNLGPLAVLADLSLPGVVEAIDLKGTVDPSSPQKRTAFRLSAGGIRPDSLAPYLEALGLRSLHENGQFVCDVNAIVASEENGPAAAEISITNIGFRDTKGELFGLDAVTLQGFGYDPNSRTARIDSVDIAGQRLALGRDETGCFNLLGFQLVGSQKTRQRDDPARSAQPGQIGQSARGNVGLPEEAEASEIHSPPPRIEIGRFSWQDNQVTFIDQAISPAKSIIVSDLGFELKDIALDFSRNPVFPGTLTAWINVPGIVDRIALSGSVSTKESGLSLDLKLSGEGLTVAEVAPYLQGLGMDSAIADGSLQAALSTDISWAHGVIDCSVAAHDVALADGQVQLVGLKRLEVSKLQLRDGGFAVDSIAIDQPYLIVSREQTGALNLAGVRLLSRQGTKQETDSQPSATHEIRVSSFSITDGRFDWSDQAVQPAVSQALRANLTLTDFGLGFDAPPSALNITLEAPGILKRADLSGKLYLTSSEQGVDLKIEASGIQTEHLTPYFSAGPKPALKDATFLAGIEAKLAEHPDGGYKASLALGNIDYHDGDGELSLLKFDSAKAALNRFDPNACIISIKELSVHGLQASAQRRTTDVLSMLGFELGSGASATESAIEPNSTNQDIAASSTERQTANAQESSEAGKSGLRQRPLITLDTLDLQLREFTMTDLTRPTANPITLSDWRIQNKQPIELLGENPDTNPVVNIDVTGKFMPFTDSVTLNTELSPFAAQPRVQAQWDVGKLDFSVLGSVLPEITTVLDPNSLKNGRLSGTAELTLNLERRDVMDLNLAKPFGIDLLLKDVQLIDTEKKKTLAGFEELHADVPKLDLGKNSIQVKEVGLVKPQGTISKESDGLHLLGVVLKIPAKEDAIDANSVQIADEVSAQATVMKDDETDNNEQELGLQVDQILVSGIDFTFVDRTTDPVVYIPLKGLDVEVRNFATQAAGVTNPIRFNTILTAGEVPLPKVGKKSGAESDNVGNTLLSQAGPESERPIATEQRLLFQEMSATGRLTLYPRLDGWVKAGVSGLELVDFKGMANEVGVVLKDGVLDASVDMRFHKEGALSTRTQIVFTDLSLTEPPDGFLRRLLSLPTSLDTVLFILQDSDGAIRLPLAFEIKEEGISRGQIVGIAVGATATLIANAVANSPFRVAGTVGDLIGGGQEEAQGVLETYTLKYAPGATVVSSEHLQTLEKVLSRMKKDKELTATIRPQLGGGDVRRADVLVNPSPEDIRELLAQLARDRTSLQKIRHQLTSEARAAYAAGYEAEARQKTQHLQQTERNLGLLERASDDLLEMMRPGTEHAAKRRTRDACLAIGKARLDAIAAILTSNTAVDFWKRVKFVPPRSTVAQEDQEGSVTITFSASRAR